MGILGYFFHRSARKNIEKNIQWCRTLHPDKRAGKIFYVWLMRGMNLADSRAKITLNIPVYYYPKGSGAPLMDFIKGFEQSGNVSMVNAAYHHFYTSFAVSFPDKGYGGLVREMWRVLLEDHTPMSEVIDSMAPLLAQADIQQLLANNDISTSELVKNPKSILPHFLVPGHPLSARLLEEEKLGRYILGE